MGSVLGSLAIVNLANSVRDASHTPLKRRLSGILKWIVSVKPTFVGFTEAMREQSCTLEDVIAGMKSIGYVLVGGYNNHGQGHDDPNRDKMSFGVLVFVVADFKLSCTVTPFKVADKVVEGEKVKYWPVHTVLLQFNLGGENVCMNLGQLPLFNESRNLHALELVLEHRNTWLKENPKGVYLFGGDMNTILPENKNTLDLLESSQGYKYYGFFGGYKSDVPPEAVAATLPSYYLNHEGKKVPAGTALDHIVSSHPFKCEWHYPCIGDNVTQQELLKKLGEMTLEDDQNRGSDHPYCVITM